MPRWEVTTESVKQAILLPIVFLLLSIAILYRSFINLDTSNLLSLMGLLGSMLLLIYFSGRFYGELFYHRDFIEIDNNNIIFRDTPGMAMGFLPKNGSISFDVIRSVDMIEISSFLNPDHKTPALYITPNYKGKGIVIGNKLNSDQIVQIVMQLKGRVTLSRALNKLLGPDVQIDDSIKQAVDFAKGVWSKFQESRK